MTSTAIPFGDYFIGVFLMSVFFASIFFVPFLWRKRSEWSDPQKNILIIWARMIITFGTWVLGLLFAFISIDILTGRLVPTEGASSTIAIFGLGISILFTFQQIFENLFSEIDLHYIKNHLEKIEASVSNIEDRIKR